MYNIVLTTAEDIVAVVDAVVAKGTNADKGFISEFTGIATEDQVDKALAMSKELSLISFDPNTDTYCADSYLAHKLVTAASDNQKAVIMRLILEQYPPYNTFKTRYSFTKSIELSCKQTKILLGISANERDIKNTLISIATYAKALKSEGANLYSFVEENNVISLIESTLSDSANIEKSLKEFWGENIYNRVSEVNVFRPLAESFMKSKAENIDSCAVVVYAANSFESFLTEIAARNNISLAGKSGILQKRDALVAVLSKKHRGIIDYIGQVRNAADHGADVDESNRMWTVSDETAVIYPCVVASVIKNILLREDGQINV